jgi:hypothetical protein
MKTSYCFAVRLVVLGAALLPHATAWAWGNEGHEIIGQIATHFLQPTVRAKIDAMLAADTSTLTAHDFVSETTWADRFRDSDRNTTKVHYLETRQWHFVDIELANGNVDTACFNHPSIPAGTPVSSGPTADCSVDKIDEFVAELRSSNTSAAEKLLALKFVMHFVGDLHQPLHAADNHDAGGNAEQVSAVGLGSGTLHGFWDTQFVQRLGADPIAVGDELAAKITTAHVTQWSIGTSTDWALESFGVARTEVYANLPKPSAKGVYALPASYVAASGPIVTLQLSRAGVRLARVLNDALAGQ